MTTNKPEVFTFNSLSEECVRLSDYEALQAECEKLKHLLRQAHPIVKSHAGASHMLEGFRPKRNRWDELLEAIDAAMQGEHNEDSDPCSLSS